MTESKTGNCANCGMPLASASNPTKRDGETYCCEGCATNGDCTCPARVHK